MKATKKPVTIECFKYDGDLKDSDGKFYVPEWAAKAYEDGTIYFKGQGEMYIKTLEGDHHAIVGDYIIRGMNGELYPCKPDVFEKTYTICSDKEAETFSFGKALELLKEGKKVCRSGWNGKGMFLTLQEGSSIIGTMMRNKPARDFYGDSRVKICPHIDMKAADGSYVVGWLASQTDMLADDWMKA